MATLQEHRATPARETYRSLLVRGLAPGEAGNLTAYLAGIEVGRGRPWKVEQVDRLLFLRELCRTGRLGADDGLGTSTAEPRAANAEADARTG